MGKKNGSGGSKTRSFEQRTLPCKLTEPELLKRGEEMAESELQIEKLKLERTDLNNQIRVAVKRRGDLAHVIDTGEEDREVKCEWLKDFKQNCMRLVRPDTKAEVETRALTASERTGDLFEEPVSADGETELPPPPRTPPQRVPRKKRPNPTATASA